MFLPLLAWLRSFNLSTFILSAFDASADQTRSKILTAAVSPWAQIKDQPPCDGEQAANESAASSGTREISRRWSVGPTSRNLVPGHLKYCQNPAKFFNGKFGGQFRFVPRGAAASGLLEFRLLTSGPGIFTSPIPTVLSPDPGKLGILASSFFVQPSLVLVFFRTAEGSQWSNSLWPLKFDSLPKQIVEAIVVSLAFWVTAVNLLFTNLT
ncbi:hypothetical protein B0H13DRAFT_2293461 [Mycena leptocephala]|nr:hypothetical protein B0H13DRAFT_2293461 [Mycena leptocephala]